MRKLLFFAISTFQSFNGRPLMLAEWAKKQGNQIPFTTGPKGLQSLNSMKSEIL